MMWALRQNNSKKVMKKVIKAHLFTSFTVARKSLFSHRQCQVAQSSPTHGAQRGIDLLKHDAPPTRFASPTFLRQGSQPGEKDVSA